MGIRPIGVPVPTQDDATQEYSPKLVPILLSLAPPSRRPYAPWNVRPFWSGLIFLRFQPVLWKLITVIHVTVWCLVMARLVLVCGDDIRTWNGYVQSQTPPECDLQSWGFGGRLVISHREMTRCYAYGDVVEFVQI